MVIRLGLERTLRLCEYLGNPQEQVPAIHIAGTNGKGSCGTFLEHALVSLGLKVGRFTSPAVFAYEELFKINETPIEAEELEKLKKEVEAAATYLLEHEEIDQLPTPFEYDTVVAFTYFARNHCDVMLIEVGMGGRSDSTNVLSKPLVSLITSISYDHMQFLGNTLAEIAAMKAGIIKSGSSVVYLDKEGQDPCIRKAIEQEMKLTGAKGYPVTLAGYEILSMKPENMEVSTPTFGKLSLKMVGESQLENIACAIRVLEVLFDGGVLPGLKSKGILSVKESLEETVWPGRFEVLNKEPLIIMDGCHNADAAQKLCHTLQETLAGYHIHFVIGVLGDKEYEKIFAPILPLGKSAACITPNNDRGLQQEVLVEVAKKYLPEENVKGFASVKEALDYALEQEKTKNTAVVVFGSLSYLGEVKEYVNEICKQTDSK